MATAAIAAGSSLLSGILSGKGASSAAKAQASAINNATQLQRDMFNTTLANEQPFISGGTGGFEQILRLLGLGDSNTGVSVNGNPALSAEQQQAGALGNLKDSPLFTGAYDTGLDAINQSAAATGGLRGGNNALAESNFGSSLFSSVYQNQLQNLFQLAGIGTNAASGLASAGQANANSVSNLLTQGGNAQASGILGQNIATTSTINDLSKLLQKSIGGGPGLYGNISDSDVSDNMYKFF